MLEILLRRAELKRFGALLQRGVAVRASACSVLELLVRDLGLAPEYVVGRITTVFLDGAVVDALDEAMLRDGSRLTLSAAMPGLVGATLRRGGRYAAMRGEITHAREHAAARPGTAATIRVKLFNLLIEEIGPALLARGVLVDRADLAELGLSADVAAAAPDAPVELRVRFD